MEGKSVRAKELDYKLCDLGYSAYLIFCGVEPDEDGNFPSGKDGKAEYAKDNPRECYDRIDEQLIIEIRKTYNLLLKKSLDENYFFIGGNYKTLVNWVRDKMSNYNDPMYGYEEEDFVKIQIDNMKFALENSVIDYTQLKETPDFEAGVDSHFLFLNYKQLSGIKRNLEKAIVILENISKERNDFWVRNNTKELLNPKKPINLKNLFREAGVEREYDVVISKLIEEKIVEKTKGGLEILIPTKYKVRGYQFFTCAIGMQLYNKGYINKDHDGQKITESLNSTFINSSVSRQNYNSLKDSPNNSDFLSYTNFIKRIII